MKKVCVQLPTSADNVALPAFAAERRAAARLLLTAGRAANDRYLLAAGPTAANPQQRRAVDWTDLQTEGQTDVRMDRYIDPATMLAVPTKVFRSRKVGRPDK